MVEEVELKDSEDFIEALGQATEEFDVVEQQVYAHGNPELNHDSVTSKYRRNKKTR